MKKTISMFIAACMIFSMAATSFAAPPGGQPGSESAGEQQPGGGESAGEQPGGGESAGGQQPGGGELAGGQQPGGESAGGQQPGGGESAGGQQPGGGGQPGGSGAEEESDPVDPLTTEEAIIVETAYAPEIKERDLTGLYIGEILPESIGDKIVAAGETWHVDDNCVVDKLEIEEGAIIEADAPVIVFFTESATVENGAVMGNVQFVNDYDEVIAIIHTNDTHGIMDAEASVKGLKDQLIDSGKYSLVLAVNGGDQYAGGYAVAHMYEGEFIPNVMNDIYDFMVWGNNDAGLTNKGIQTYLLSILGNETGLTTLVANQRAAEDIDIAAYAAEYVPTVGAETFVSMYPDVLALNEDGSIDYSGLNLADYNLKAGDNACVDGAIVETAKGTKLGIFGESTQGGSITDAYFSGGMSSVDTAKTMVDALTEKGADSVIMIGHVGWMGPDSTEASSNDTNSAQLAKETPGLDAIIDAHTHSVINDGEGYIFAGYGSNPIVNQASCKGAAVGVLYLYLKDGKVIAKDCENLLPDENGQLVGVIVDEAVQADVDLALQRLADDGYVKVVATTPYFLNGERISSGDVGGGVRANETNLGDLVADAVLAASQKIWTENEIKAAFYVGFWVRASIAEGDITLVDALSVFANPLKIHYAEYTAQEILDIMTTSCEKLGSENNSMYQVAGINCTYDPATMEVVTLSVADELIYDHGSFLVDDSWTAGCAMEIGGADMDSVTDDVVIIPSNTDMAKEFCSFLETGDYVIYPDEIGAGGRVVPAN